ncbi:mitochondrial CDP-diglyceride synthetase [Andalucia godoyi]|uniref:Phosphatidate cytidylyltransferase n=1 Tax=Andalucia godoyi TaxID=505711 RepID=A0A8K0F4H3_ANDGO|nr:mitochondrial CDP-diglyceride synthetase [Andalucia godoyi]|eukprot:ANDGO_01474.mRNA.1 mitochondrial CDP-diglyceride synthetase
MSSVARRTTRSSRRTADGDAAAAAPDSPSVNSQTVGTSTASRKTPIPSHLLDKRSSLQNSSSDDYAGSSASDDDDLTPAKTISQSFSHAATTTTSATPRSSTSSSSSAAAAAAAAAGVLVGGSGSGSGSATGRGESGGNGLTAASASLTGANGSGNTAAAPSVLLKDSPERWKNFVVRTVWTLLMISGFAVILFMGHLSVILFVLALQAQMFREIVRINVSRAYSREIPGHRRFTGTKALSNLNYFFLFCTLFFVYGKMFLAKIPQARGILEHHQFYSFMLFCAGFVAFVMSLQRNKLKKQFHQFGLMILSLLFIVVLSSAVVQNVMEGLFWFVFPALLIIANDITAYLFGFFFGKTPLIALSPKKTWEGFIGATVSTIFLAFICAEPIGSVNFLQCSHTDIFAPSNDCSSRNPIFDSDTLKWHMMVLGAFAATIAPFGGFFASGFKRAFAIKDFGDAIPGHGGITDRMDCQTLMAMFVYVYYRNFLAVKTPPSPYWIMHKVQEMPIASQLDLFNMLHDHLRSMNAL